MIPLRIQAEVNGTHQPFIARLNSDFGSRATEFDVFLTEILDGISSFEGSRISLRIQHSEPTLLDGDVLLVVPQKKIAHRLIRSSSPDNTMVFTEDCDERCLMCSQPPVPGRGENSDLLKTAVLLAPDNMTIGISGGEPTLFKYQLFQFLEFAQTHRPDLAFHILSNAQHIEQKDLPFLRSLNHKKVTWGIPLYSDRPEEHDKIVQKQGAFLRLQDSLSVFCKSGSAIEMRTVVLKENVLQLPKIADFLSVFAPFICQWSIMQLENIGYARQRWDSLFFDTSIDFFSISEAIGLASIYNINPRLFNFPLCTVPEIYHPFAVSSISDWKVKFIDECEDCAKRDHCSGFFGWENSTRSFERICRL